MFAQTSRVSSLFKRIPVTDSLKTNQGLIYVATTRAMGSEVGSGSGKGGGTGGRLVRNTDNKDLLSKQQQYHRRSETPSISSLKPPKSFTAFIRSAFKLILSPSHDDVDSHIHSIREAGGAMGKKGAAQEEQYFNKQNKDLKEKLKGHLKEEIKKHEDAIKANKELLKDM